MPSTTNSSIIRVALVDDDVSFQNAMMDAIATSSDIGLLSVVGTQELGLSILNGPSVDVLIVDLGLPDGSGIDIIRATHAKWPDCNVMVSTTFGDELHVMQSLEAGATGYLLKDSEPKNLIDEIRSLHNGGSPISPLIARKILTRFRNENKKNVTLNEKPSVKLNVGLSMREQEVLEYITKGFSSNEIAGLMSVSPHTILTYVRRIYTKLKVTSKAEAIYEARSQGLLDN